MDSELSTKISGVIKRLAEREQQRLRAAGTFVELEVLACEIAAICPKHRIGCRSNVSEFILFWGPTSSALVVANFLLGTRRWESDRIRRNARYPKMGKG